MRAIASNSPKLYQLRDTYRDTRRSGDVLAQWLPMKLAYGVKRLVKSARNLVVDPLPRNRRLSLVRLRLVENRIEYHYEIAGSEYINSITFPANLSEALRQQACPAMDQLLTAIGLFLAPFFFRMTDFQTVAVRTTTFDAPSKRFLESCLQGMLGEFRFLQGLDPSRRVEIDVPEGGAIEPMRYDTPSELMLCNGGGKDTVVCAELLKAAEIDFTWFSVHMNAARQRVIDRSGVSASVHVDYSIDDRIDQEQVYAWGHVPRTPINSSLALLIAILKRVPYVTLGNEYSANEGNVQFKGTTVNHQYAKSFEFERGFAQFIRSRITTSTQVFSMLRPFHDLQLAGMLADRPEHLGTFVSCNRGILQDQWCKECEKCAFVALAIGAFLGREGVLNIFGEDVFLRPKIRRHILDLVVGAVKPWECVGTRDECLTALGMVLQADPKWDFREFPRRSDFAAVLDKLPLASIRESVLAHASSEHLIPAEVLSPLNRGIASFRTSGVQIPQSSISIRTQ